MKDRTLAQLGRLARALLDECRRVDAEAAAAIGALEATCADTARQRRVVLSGGAGLPAQAVADCSVALDRREARLREELAEARLRAEQTHRRVLRAHREVRALGRLGELRDRAEAERRARALAAEIDDLARAVRWRRNEEERSVAAELT